MAVREFTDATGREWRAWDIKPHEIHPVTKSEDFLAECYVTGWIVFETITGDEKRRLCPWPIHWADESEEGLRELLGLAEVVPAYRLTNQRISREWEVPGTTPPKPADELDITDLQVVRAFRDPGGRMWVVSVVPSDDGGPPVLRFSSGTRFIDLRKWRKDWADQPDEMLVFMLTRVAPQIGIDISGPGSPRRRRDDR